MRFEKHNRQGYFGECFVQALTSAAGLIAGEYKRDFFGVDYVIGWPDERSGVRYPKIEVQVKSWHTPRGDPEYWHYRMKARHYNGLAGGPDQVSRFLFLVIVPVDAGDYAHAEPQALLLRHCAYWASFAGQARIDEQVQQTTTVRVPKQNLLTVHELQRLLGRVPAPRTAP